MPTNERPRHTRRSTLTPEDVAERPERDRETRRELAKLTATFLNGLATAVVAIGD